MESPPLAERHALVTGGAKGIGYAVAAQLAALGAGLTLLGREDAALNTARKALEAAHGVEVATRQLDLAAPDAAAGLGALAAERPVDILVNNAGASAAAPFERIDIEHWRRLLEVNLTAAFLCTQAVLPGMRERGWGRIVNVASTAGLRGYAYVAAYCAAKHGVIGMTRSLALELAATGVTVNAVCPGFVRSEMTERSIANIVAKTGRTEAQALAELVRFNPQRRLVEPEEVAHAVGFLVSPGASSMNGQSLSVAGGETM